MNKTINFYNDNAEQYISQTFGADMSKQYRFFLKQIPSSGRILDLGCGSGRDSKYFLENGYDVVAVDGSVEFCRMVQGFLDCEVMHLSFDEVDFQDEFDGIWACASLLHLPKTDLPEMFRKLSRALRQGGVMYCSFKYGDFEGERDGRYYSDFTEDSLVEIIGEVPGFQVLDLGVGRDLSGGVVSGGDVSSSRDGDIHGDGRVGLRWVWAVVRRSVESAF